MIIMLDGTNGVGKTTYAYKLSEMLGIKVCRVFRSSDKELHWGSADKGAIEKELKSLKVPINTHIDDIFMADFIKTFQVDAILDRTIVSAVAYGRVYSHLRGWYKEKGNVARLMEFWSALIEGCKHPISYVWLDAAYDVSKRRCDAKRLPNKVDYERLRAVYRNVFRNIEFPKICINTDSVSIADGIGRIIRLSQII